MTKISPFEWLIHLITSWALFGLIWTIQLSHYPTFRFIANADFSEFHNHHTFSISIIVLPLMLLELGLVTRRSYHSNWNRDWLIAFGLIILIWASTFFIQVPLHEQLEKGKDLNTIQQLVTSNWIRSFLWSVKAIWISFLFLRKNKM